MKGYSTFPNDPGLETQHQMQLGHSLEEAYFKFPADKVKESSSSFHFLKGISAKVNKRKKKKRNNRKNTIIKIGKNQDLRILKAGTIKQIDMKDYTGKTMVVLEPTLNWRN